MHTDEHTSVQWPAMLVATCTDKIHIPFIGRNPKFLIPDTATVIQSQSFICKEE